MLLTAATTYMDYLRDSAIVEVQKSNVRVLEQTLKQTRDRFNVGEVTRTDVAQSEAQLAAGKTQELTAESNLVTTQANYRRVIGNEPVNLAPGSPVDRYLPPTLPQAVELSLIENPNVTAAMYGVDVNFLQVKVNEGALLPTVTLQGSVQQAYEQTLISQRSFGASAIAQVSVPIYQGGAEYSLIRQSKETLAQQRLNLETTRDQTRANTVTAWGQLVAGKAQVVVGAGAGAGLRDRAQRRARRSQGRTAHHARRAQRPAGAGQRARRAGDRAARSRGGLLFHAQLDRPPVAADPEPADHHLRSQRALSAGARQLGRRAHARRALIRPAHPPERIDCANHLRAAGAFACNR